MALLTKWGVSGPDQLQMYIIHSSSLKVNVSFRNMYYWVHSIPIAAISIRTCGAAESQLITRRFKAQCLCGITEFSEWKTVHVREQYKNARICFCFWKPNAHYLELSATNRLFSLPPSPMYSHSHTRFNHNLSLSVALRLLISLHG